MRKKWHQLGDPVGYHCDRGNRIVVLPHDHFMKVFVSIARLGSKLVFEDVSFFGKVQFLSVKIYGKQKF